MIFFNIKPIFVLDSTKIIDLKLAAVSQRLAGKHQSTNQNRANFNRLIKECSELLTYLGLPIIRADGEAEKLCAQLNQMNIVDVVITNDSDCFVYGATTIIRNFGIDTKSISFDIYDREEIESNCQLNQRSLLVLALLLGSDYDSQGLQGIGRENALKFLQSLPTNLDPVDYLRKILRRSYPENKYQQRVFNLLKANPNIFKQFDKIIEEYSSKESKNLPLIASIASIKWLKPVRIKELQLYMKKKLDWMESYTFTKVFPLLTRFQILYRLNMLELDVDDVLSLSDTTVFQPICIKKVRIRQCKHYYEVEWKQHELPSTCPLEDQMGNLSLIILENDDDEDKLITIEPADLFRHAYPEVVHRFEVPVAKGRKAKKTTTTTIIHDERSVMKKKKCKTSSTSMSLDLLSMIQDQTLDIPNSQTIGKDKTSKFHHRPTMAALSTSISLEVLSILQKSHGNLNPSKSRPIKHQTRSDMFIQTRKPVTLLNTSLSLDVLDILLREKQQQQGNDDCTITDIFVNERNKLKIDDDLLQLSSLNHTDDDNQDVLPLPLWDRIRQRTAV